MFLLVAGILSGFIPLRATTLWLSPAGTGDGSSATNRKKFVLSEVNQWLADNRYAVGELELVFGPGNYTLVSGLSTAYETSLSLSGGLNTAVTIRGELDAQGTRPTLILGSIQDNTYYAPFWGAPDYIPHHWLIKTGSIGGLPCYLKKVVIRDLVLDGNFSQQGAWTSEANAGGYKSFAIDVAAQTGLLANVVVRNFGSVGQVPQSPMFLSAGVEAFPVSVRAIVIPNHPLLSDPFLQSLPPGELPYYQYPWIIENVEVSNFQSVHGGYGTMIMANAYQNTWGTVDDPAIILVRQCRVLGGNGTIAFGAAGSSGYKVYVPPQPPQPTPPVNTTSGRVRFKDNVVINSSKGFNTDTGFIGPITLENNAFLDIEALGAVGVS